MLSISDFDQPFYGLKRQGTSANPKTVPLVVIAWEPQGKGEPSLDAAQLDRLIFGPNPSLADWFRESSQGRFKIVPLPNRPIAGPFVSVHNHQLYWRAGPYDPANLSPGDPHRWDGPDGNTYYLDDEKFVSGFTHSYAEAVRLASEKGGVDFGALDANHDGVLTPDECLILVAKAQSTNDGFERYHTACDYTDYVCGSHVPWSPLIANQVEIHTIAEAYCAPPHGADDLALVVEEVLHFACDLGDQYTNPNRPRNDPGRPTQLSLTDAGGPVQVDPYHKLKWGWLNPQLADHSGRYTLRDAATTGDALILYNPILGTSEFFILENRWRGGSYDRYRSDSYGEGFALWHCIQDPALAGDWARRAVFLRRADPRINSDGNLQDHLALWDGSDPARGYDLTDDSFPQNLRFRDGLPSQIRLRNISAAGSVMTVDVEVPPALGEIVAVEGHIRMLRVHECGTGYGPPQHRLNEDCIVTLDTQPGLALGVALSGPAASGRRMFNQLRKAMQNHTAIRLEYEVTGALGGHVIRVIQTA